MSVPTTEECSAAAGGAAARWLAHCTLMPLPRISEDRRACPVSSTMARAATAESARYTKA